MLSVVTVAKDSVLSLSCPFCSLISLSCSLFHPQLCPIVLDCLERQLFFLSFYFLRRMMQLLVSRIPHCEAVPAFRLWPPSSLSFVPLVSNCDQFNFHPKVPNVQRGFILPGKQSQRTSWVGFCEQINIQIIPSSQGTRLLPLLRLSVDSS